MEHVPGWAKATLVAALIVVAQAPLASAYVPIDALSPFGDEHIVVAPSYPYTSGWGPAVAIANAGDVNGDGADDTAVMLDRQDPATFTPGVWVSFSQPTPVTTQTTGQAGWEGFRIVGSDFGWTVAGIPDLNGDGLGEIAGTAGYGRIFVVFGRVDGQTVDLRDLGDDGFMINGVEHLSGGGFGIGWDAWASISTAITAVGDQNGDGRPEIAFRELGDVKVAFTPAEPAGAEIDADALGNGGFTLTTDGGTDPFPARLGDLDGDGREDLGVIWHDSGGPTVRAVGVSSPAPGTTVNLRRAVEDGIGFEFVAPNSYMENAISIGDQNGDGKREMAIVAFGDAYPRGRELLIGYTPSFGVRRVIHPMSPSYGKWIEVYAGIVTDVGDQDGDSVSDVAFTDWVQHSSQPGFKGLYFAGLGGMIVGSVSDRNADGKQELVTARAVDAGGGRATVTLDIYFSAERPVPETVESPWEFPGGIEFSGTFSTAKRPTRTLAGRASVELTDQHGYKSLVESPKLVDAGGRRTRVRVDVRSGLTRGQTYTYRLRLENGRGLIGASPAHRFTYRGPTLGPARASEACKRGRRRLIAGTGRRDRLRGTARADVLRGYGARDRLSGRGGGDCLDGGSGNDRIVPGKGRDRVYGRGGNDYIDSRDGSRDVVSCGRGRDRVRADRRDRVRGCERVRRWGLSGSL